jgi:hypothetical protein
MLAKLYERYRKYIHSFIHSYYSIMLHLQLRVILYLFCIKFHLKSY